LIQESAFPVAAGNYTPSCSRSLMEVDCPVFWFPVDVKQEFIPSRAIFNVLGTPDIVFA